MEAAEDQPRVLGPDETGDVPLASRCPAGTW